MRRYSRNFLISSTFIFSVILFLVLAEGTARWFYVEPWYNALVKDVGVKVSENKNWRRSASNMRFRGTAYSGGLIRDDHRRVLVLGDSFTFGSGVRDTSAIFTSLLEKRLNENLPLPNVKRYDVLNGGISASLTDEWVVLYKHTINKFKPDVVLVVFFMRDGTLIKTIPEIFDRIRENIVQRNAQSLMYRVSYVYRTARDYVDLKATSQEYVSNFLDAYFGNDTEEWVRAQKNIMTLKELARQDSAEMGFVVFPVLYGLRGEYPFKKIGDLLYGNAAENGIPALDLTPAFTGMNAADLWVSSSNQHPNEKAHAIAAEAMYGFLVERLQASEAE